MGSFGYTSLHDHQSFEREADELKALGTAGTAGVAWDTQVRLQYQEAIRSVVERFRGQATSGHITWAQAAEKLQQARNDVMELMRGRSTPVGRAIAEKLKAQGKTLNELIARYTLRMFGPGAFFDKLTAAEKDRVYAEIVEAAARSNPRVDLIASRVRVVSRSLLVISLGISIWQIYTSDDPVEATKKEVALTGGGIAGGIAGGALAGLACGPGAPVCVAIGAFIGGALAVWGVDAAWSSGARSP